MIKNVPWSNDIHTDTRGKPSNTMYPETQTHESFIM